MTKLVSMGRNGYNTDMPPLSSQINGSTVGVAYFGPTPHRGRQLQRFMEVGEAWPPGCIEAAEVPEPIQANNSVPYVLDSDTWIQSVIEEDERRKREALAWSEAMMQEPVDVREPTSVNDGPLAGNNDGPLAGKRRRNIIRD